MHHEVKILVIEDDFQVQRFLQILLHGHGYRVDSATNANEGLDKVNSLEPDVILLDLGLPDMDGLNMVSRIRKDSSVPIVVISARDQENDKVRALDNGADDYLTKPFGSSELLARIRVALRHTDRQDATRQLVFRSEPLTIDLSQRLVWRHGELVHLTPIEYRILELLASNNGKVSTYRQILKEVWGANHVEQNHYVRVHMAQLRHKLEDLPAQPRFLLTENGVGYRFRFQSDDTGTD
jgi:two-component system KDP operon response regulator KdpE